MKITSLSLENFRCFKKLSLNFHPQFNVLIGENGSGKTAVMEALAKAIGNAFPMDVINIIPSLPIFRKEDKDIRYIDTSLGKERVLADAVKVSYILSNNMSFSFDYKNSNAWNPNLLQQTKALLESAKSGEK